MGESDNKKFVTLSQSKNRSQVAFRKITFRAHRVCHRVKSLAGISLQRLVVTRKVHKQDPRLPY